MKRLEALETIADGLGDSEPVVTTLGIISREFYEIDGSERTFPMAGSMGLASSIGLGVALNKPDTRVVVIDGDGSLLLNLGSIVSVGHHSPDNMTHIVLDNGAYASCSREPTLSGTAQFDRMATLVGYEHVHSAKTREELAAAVAREPEDGPQLIHARIETGGQRHPARLLDLPYFKRAFTEYLASI